MKRVILIAAVLAVGVAAADWRGRFDEQFAQLFGGETWTPAALNPIAWWSFESAPGGVVSDIIASKSMTLTGSPTISAGLRGNAITTAAGKYGSFTPFPATTNFSINVWAKTEITTGEMLLLGRSDNINVRIEVFPQTTFAVRQGGAAVSYTIPSIGSVWRMYTVTCTGSGVRVYLDGAESSSGVKTVADANINTVNQIGRLLASTSFFWNGQIDELTFFNYPLSQSQITQLYNYR